MVDNHIALVEGDNTRLVEDSNHMGYTLQEEEDKVIRKVAGREVGHLVRQEELQEEGDKLMVHLNQVETKYMIRTSGQFGDL